jgi:hypothetical protein
MVKQAKGTFFQQSGPENGGDVISDVQESCFGVIVKTGVGIAAFSLLVILIIQIGFFD